MAFNNGQVGDYQSNIMINSTTVSSHTAIQVLWMYVHTRHFGCMSACIYLGVHVNSSGTEECGCVSCGY